MSNNPSFPKVGVAFVAENLPQYIRALEQATEAENAFAKSITALSTKIEASNKSDVQKQQYTNALTESTKKYTAAVTELVKAVESGDAARMQKALAGLNGAYGELSSTVARTKATLSQSSSETDKLGNHFTSVSSAIGASRVGVGLFTRELVQMAGGSNVAVQALDSFVFATGSLGLALGAVTAALVIIREGTKAVTESFEKNQQTVANSVRSYEALAVSRQKAMLTTPEGAVAGVLQALPIAAGAIVQTQAQRLGDQYGQAFLKGLAGKLTSIELLQIWASNLPSPQLFGQFGQQAALEFAKQFKKTQEEIVTQQFVAGAQNRSNASALGLEIGQLELEGKSLDEVIPKIYDYLQAKRAIGEAQGSGIGGAITGADVESFAQAFFPARALSAKAQTLYKQLRDVQTQYNEDTANLASEHGSRILEIETRSWEQQVRLAREYSQRKKAIQDQYDQDKGDAFADHNSRLADAEKDAQDRRDKIVAEHADRRAKIEQDYQDRVAQIQSDYQLALFDIGQRFDANGLVRARLQRDKSLADAARTRDRENKENEKQKEKQEKELKDSLERQKREIEQAYEKRLRDLEQAFNKQNAANKQNYDDALADLKQSTTDQYNAENASYTKRQKALDDAKQKRIDALTDELFTTKALYEKYGQAIIDSLAKVLDPATIVDLVNGLQKALDTKIEIKITPNAGAGGVSAGMGGGGPVANPSGYGTPHAAGGYIAQNERAYLHAGETVLPTNASRAYMLAMQHMERVQMPMGTRSASYAGSGGKVYIYVDNNVNSAMLDSQIHATSIGVTTEIIKRGMR